MACNLASMARYTTDGVAETYDAIDAARASCQPERKKRMCAQFIFCGFYSFNIFSSNGFPLSDTASARLSQERPCDRILAPISEVFLLSLALDMDHTDNLPDELVVFIFSFLSCAALGGSASRVCA
jgi:hypothetical protein